MFRLLAERDRHGQEKRHWTDRTEIRNVLGLALRTDNQGESREEKIDDEIDDVLERFGIALAHSGEDSGELRGGGQRHPFLSMSPEGVIDVSHEALIRKWPIYQSLLSAEEASGEAYKGIVASFRRTLTDVSAPEQAPEKVASRRLIRRLRSCSQWVRARWNLLFSPDSVVTSAEKRRAVHRWLQGRDFEFENGEADRHRSLLQRTLRRLERLWGLERLTELGRSVHFARSYNEPWSERHIPDIDKVQPEDREPILAENQRLFPHYTLHAKTCMRWHFGAKVVVPCILLLGISVVGGVAYYWRQAERLRRNCGDSLNFTVKQPSRSRSQRATSSPGSLTRSSHQPSRSRSRSTAPN